MNRAAATLVVATCTTICLFSSKANAQTVDSCTNNGSYCLIANNAGTSTPIGIQAQTSGGKAISGSDVGSGGIGVYGDSHNSPGGYGVYGEGYGTNGGSSYAGVYGTNDGVGPGVYGQSAGYGVRAQSTGADGVHSETSYPDAYGVWGDNSDGGVGVYGTASSGGVGVWGSVSGGLGVVGWGNGGGVSAGAHTYGVYGTSADEDGVHGEVDNTWSGVSGVNDWTGTCTGVQCVGVYGLSSSAASYGVYAKSPESTAGYAAGYFYATANSNLANGVAGVVDYNGTGGYFRTHGGYGVYAIDQGSGSGGSGVYGTSDNGYGVFGVTSGTSSSAVGVYGVFGGGSSYAGYFSGTTNVEGCLQSWGSNVYGCSSDRRLKKDIEPLAGALPVLLQLKGVTYNWLSPADHGKNGASLQRGFVAQDVESVFPQWVGQDTNGFKTLTIPPNEITALEVESIRTLEAENTALRARVTALESGQRRTVAGIDLSGIGFAAGGLAVACGLVLSRRNRKGQESTL